MQDENFKDYQSKLQRLESKESLRRDYLFEREQKLIGDLAHSQKQDEHERMRRHTSNYYDKIKDQVSLCSTNLSFAFSLCRKYPFMNETLTMTSLFFSNR